MYQDEKIKSLVKDLAGDFLERESNKTSLVTVTRVELIENGHKAAVFFTVLPENKEDEVVQFTKRKRSDFRDYVDKKARIGRMLSFDFILDQGEKNRQKIDEALRESK